MNDTSGGDATGRPTPGAAQPVEPVTASDDLPFGPVGGPPLMAQVREGMAVVDSAGERVGTVEYVQMGEPDADTAAGSEVRSGSLLEAAGVVEFTDEAAPHVPREIRSQLLREGFVKVHAPWLAPDRYVRSDHIAAVEGDTVRLNVPKDELPRAG